MEIIETEKDAWKLLELILKDKISNDQASQIALGDWASLELAVSGDRYRASLTPRIMSSLLAFHRNLSQSLALAAYGSADGRRLTSNDIEQLQLDFVINKGSTKIVASLAKAIEKVGGKIETLPPKDFLLVTIVVGLLYCGQVAIQGYFENEQAVERTKQGVLENERMRMLAAAYARLDERGIKSKIIQELASSAYLGLIDAIPDADGASIGGVQLEGEELEILQNRNLEPYDGPRKLKGAFVVEGLSNKYEDRYYLTLRQGNKRIRAHYDPREIDEKTRDEILQALDKKLALNLNIRITDRYKHKRQLTGEIETFN